MMLKLTDFQIDTITELLNVGVNDSTNILSDMLNVEIDLNIPNIQIISTRELFQQISIFASPTLSAVNMEFRNGFSGISQIVFSQESANKLVNVFSREVLNIDDSNEIDELKAGALVEIGNIILNAVLSKLSNFFHHEFQFYVPEYYENNPVDFLNKLRITDDDVIIIGETLFKIEEYKITGDIIIYLNIKSFNYFISLIDNYLKSYDEEHSNAM